MPAPPPGHQTRSLHVAVGFFDAFDVPLLSGRRFESRDLDAGARAVIVNRTFVHQFLSDDAAIGRRVRFVASAGNQSEPWFEIIGVVDNFPAHPIVPGQAEARLYHPSAPGTIYPSFLFLHVSGAAPTTFAPRLREVTAQLDPALRLRQIRGLDEVYEQEQTAVRLTALAFGMVTLSVVLLSAAGIYALMSFTVAERRREIAIRAALGANGRRLIVSIYSHVLSQLAIGVVAGAVIAIAIGRFAGNAFESRDAIVFIPGVSAFMMSVALIAAIGPIRRGLHIQPTDALRDS
jgi:putative ABC transport system permease protein